MKIPLADKRNLGGWDEGFWVGRLNGSDLIWDCNSQSGLWMVRIHQIHCKPDVFFELDLVFQRKFTVLILMYKATRQVARQRLGIACLLATCFSTAHSELQHLTALFARFLVVFLKHVSQQHIWNQHLIALFACLLATCSSTAQLAGSYIYNHNPLWLVHASLQRVSQQRISNYNTWLHCLHASLHGCNICDHNQWVWIGFKKDQQWNMFCVWQIRKACWNR